MDDEPRRRGRLWHRVVGTGLGSVLLLGGVGTAAVADEEADDPDGDEPGEDEASTAQSDGELEGCEPDFGLEKEVAGVIAVFDDADFEPEDLVGERVVVPAERSPQGEECEATIESAEWLTHEEYEEAVDDADGQMPDVPEHDGEYILGLEFRVPPEDEASIEAAGEGESTAEPQQEDPDTQTYLLEVLWDHPVAGALALGEEFSACPHEEIGGLIEHEDCLRFALENPVIFAPPVQTVDVDLAAEWVDHEGGSTDAPDEDWEIALTGEGDSATLPGDPDATLEVGSEYAVAADLPDGWDEVDCDEAEGVVATGTGEFTAEEDGTHLVCVAEQEPEPEPAPVVPVSAAADDDVLPATGTDPLPLALVGLGLLGAGAAAVRRTRTSLG